MKTKERYQQFLDEAYQHAPFRLIHVIDFKHATPLRTPKVCMVCGNKRLRYLCNCTDNTGITWHIGRNCYSKLQERYEEEHRQSGTGL